MNRSRAPFALGASFSVYLIPLVGPHAAWFLGQALFHGDARRSPQWAANWTVALFFQLLAAGFFYWFFGKPGWRRGIFLLLAVPFAFLTLQWVYLVAIPTRFLEEPDTEAEAASWPSTCTAPGVYQTNLRTTSELWVRFNAAPNNYAVLTTPGCWLTAVSLPQPTYKPGTGVDFMIEPTSVISGRQAIVRKDHTKEARQSWWLTAGSPDASLLPLEPPAGHSSSSGAPILSTDGEWVAWLELRRVFLRPRVGGEKEKIVDLRTLGPASYSLHKLDMQSGELMLWKTDRLIAVGLDGALRKEFGRPVAARPQQNTYLEMGEYWIAWDAYRENGPYLVEWSLGAGAGTHRVPLGRTIHSAAVDRAGKWIAVSVGTSLNIGKARDAVYVLSAGNGREVFRKYLPRYSRSPVAFLEDGFFVYSDSSGVRVLRVPE